MLGRWKETSPPLKRLWISVILMMFSSSALKPVEVIFRKGQNAEENASEKIGQSKMREIDHFAHRLQQEF